MLRRFCVLGFVAMGCGGNDGAGLEVVDAGATTADASAAFTVDLSFNVLMLESYGCFGRCQDRTEVQADGQVAVVKNNVQTLCTAAPSTLGRVLAVTQSNEKLKQIVASLQSCPRVTDVSEKISIEIARGVWVIGESFGCRGEALDELRAIVTEATNACVQ